MSETLLFNLRKEEMEIVIYSKDHCPGCVTAKNILKARNITFVEKSVEQKENLDELLAKYPETRQMPQIFIDDQRVGGVAGLNAALAQLGL